MPVVEKTSGGTVRVRGIGEFAPGDRAEVSTADAQYLVEERGDFELVDDGSEDADDVVTAYAFPDGDELSDLTVGEVQDRLATGSYDHVLDEIESAETHGKDRTTVHEAIETRRSGGH